MFAKKIASAIIFASVVIVPTALAENIFAGSPIPSPTEKITLEENLLKISNGNNVSNNVSLGNPFEQFQMTQGHITTLAIAGAFPQPKAFVNSQLMWNTRSIPVCWTTLDAAGAIARG